MVVLRVICTSLLAHVIWITDTGILIFRKMLPNYIILELILSLFTNLSLDFAAPFALGIVLSKARRLDERCAGRGLRLTFIFLNRLLITRFITYAKVLSESNALIVDLGRSLREFMSGRFIGISAIGVLSDLWKVIGHRIVIIFIYQKVFKRSTFSVMLNSKKRV